MPIDATAVELDGVVVPVSLAEKAELGSDEPSRGHRLLMKVIDARSRVWTMNADLDYDDEGWKVATIDLTTGRNTNYLTPPEPPLVIHTMWIERSSVSGGFILDGSTLLVSELRAVTPGGSVLLEAAELTNINGLDVRPGVSGDTAA